MIARKRPVEVKVEQFFPDKKPWPSGVMVRYNDISDRSHVATGWFMNTLEGPFNVTPGDYIITGVAGEKYPCKAAIFEATYDIVSM